MNEYLTCCGKTCSVLDEKPLIDCYKSNRFFKKFTTEKEEIKKELLLVSFCTNCKHYILKYLWYTRKSAGFFNYAETKTIKGKKADEIFNSRVDDLELTGLPKRKQKNIKHSKKIPLVYYKAINANWQVPRYLDESDNAGNKVFSSVKEI